MALVDLDSLTITEEERQIEEAARRFAIDVLRPISIELDKMATPQEVIAEDSRLWEAFREYRKRDFHKASVRKELGGLGLGGMAMARLTEQMGWGASDLYSSLSVSAFPFLIAGLSPDPEVQKLSREYLEDEDARLVGCWAITEPDHGSDWILAASEEGGDDNITPSVKAVPDGDEYVISGQKAAWVSNGTIATHAALFAGLDPSRGMRGGGIAVVPLDLPGVSRGEPLQKLGARALNQGEIFFDEVRIPSGNMIIAETELHARTLESILTGANAGVASMFVGVAQAAFDEAFAYAEQRIQGGKPIIEHQNIKLRLFDMFRQVEAARSLARRAFVYNTTSQTPAIQYSIAAKTFCTEVSLKVAGDAIQILGGAGLTKEYHVEKLFRDARASTIEDGVNETLALAAMERLRE